jgi:hypothetical protein
MANSRAVRYGRATDGEPWHCLYLRPDPHGHGWLRDGSDRTSDRRPGRGPDRTASPSSEGPL